ncbi:1-acyl-sn-glycerol-3-phosphate acyltransferase PLS1 [Dichanthelium oligosanthes]|uniref:1-acylglycerol-3-phosphate O-acyltransferase n=1 Tax=Dichanthelium oligosanthes TaxID=888268 RepID=A0A1E5W8A3_9POAL|nr:1-acyl-sn-glycerol-3-phosphate acyltransferase PLS1 [Dichanthelium oligosanthes]
MAAIPLVLVVLPLGLLFLLSGLIVNAVQVQLHANQETYQLMGKEHALIISNHRSDIDWLIGWILAQRSGCLGSTLAIMKKSSKFLPVIGWSMWFAEYLFLERSWAKDEKTLKWGLKRLKDFPRSFWLALFVEGTRFTPAKLLAAQEYAASQGLPAPRNVLIPRTKGFVSAVSIMRDFVPAIYDTTVIIPKDSPAPTMLRILKGQSSVLHVRIKRHAMSDMPKSDEDVSKWCKDIFVAKDALLDKHIATGTFDEEIRPIGRPIKSLLAPPRAPETFLHCFFPALALNAAMAIPALLTVLPIGLLFLLSGLAVNAVQAVVFLSIRPLSRSLCRRINGFLAEFLWLQPVWLLDWWAGVKVQLHAEPETYQLMGKEHALVIANHRGDIDWLIGWILAQVIGWSMWFSEYIFLEGSWAKDQNTIEWGLQRLKDFPRSFWLALFVEGTRITPAKLAAAQEYAASQGLPSPRNVLIPRTKGFVLAVTMMRDFVPAIYDMTVITPKDLPAPTLLRMLKGQPSVVHVHVERHAMGAMPKSDEEVSKWCKDIFVAKDALLDKHIETGSFGDEIRPIGRPLKSLLVNP